MNDIAFQIVELRKQGISIKQIVAKLGCSKSTVSKWCAILSNNKEIIESNIKNRKPDYGKQYEMQLLSHLVTRENDAKRIWTIKTRELAKKFLVAAGNNKCQACGYDKYMGNLTFHHIDPSLKEFELNGMRLTYNLLRLINEAKKCALLCHNCHGEYHAGVRDKQLIPLNFDKILIPNSLIEWGLNLV